MKLGGRFTIAHECSHVLLHNARDLEESAKGAAAHTLSVDPARDLADGRKVKNWVEWQANNRLGACLLMPKSSMKLAIPQVAEPDTQGHYVVDIEGVQALSQVFEVSVLATKIRIEQLRKEKFTRACLGPDAQIETAYST